MRTLGLGIGLGGSRAATPAWTPASLPSLVFWPRAKTLAATPVTSWSYGVANLTQATGAKEPAWTAASANMNGKPSVVYDGARSMAAANTVALQLTGDITVCTAVYLGSLRSFNTILSKGSVSEFEMSVDSTGAFTCQRRGASATDSMTSGAGKVAAAVPQILTFVQIGTAASFYVNGVLVASPTASHNPYTATTNPVMVGQRADAATSLIGEQPEVVVCNAGLTGSDLTKLHAYMLGLY